MKIRAFDWRDLPTLHRYRRQSIFLHSSLLLTRGPVLISGALLSTLSPATGIFTSVSIADGDGGQVLIGQTVHTPGSQCAQLTFLVPDAALNSAALPALLEHLSAQAVEHGALRLVAEVEERTQAFEALRRVGFATYARQHIWRVDEQPSPEPKASGWRPATERDLIAVRSLYNNLIPGLVQQVEPFPAERLHGMVYQQDDDVLAYVELKYGHRGIWAQPFIHPDVEEVSQCVTGLLRNLPIRPNRPVFVCIRSYQSWLEVALDDLGAEPLSHQAIMVKHLAVPQKAFRSYPLPALEGGHPEVSAPISGARFQEPLREAQPWVQMES